MQPHHLSNIVEAEMAEKKKERKEAAELMQQSKKWSCLNFVWSHVTSQTLQSPRL